MPAEKVIVDRLHVHGPKLAGPDPVGPVGLRLGLEQALGQLRPRPADLPPQAILVVRRLDGPAAFGRRPADRRRWGRQVEAQLEALARQAPRPGRQFVPPQANAVLFADPVDMLICASRDLLAGRWAWYWDELLPAAARPGWPFGQRLLAAWLAEPQAVPHTLAALAPDEAAAMLARLNPAELSHLAHNLHDTFALPRGALDATAPAAPDRSMPDAPGRPAAAPWREWLPAAATAGLSPAAVYILGLSHTLARRPHQARQPAFADQARRWLEAALAAESALDRAPRPERSPPAAIPRPVEPAAGAGVTPLDDSPAVAGPDQAQAAAEQPAAMTAEEPAAFDDRAAAARLSLGDGAFTSLGGAIYFVNLLADLGLPEAVPALAGLNPWELLGGLVVALLGETAGDFAADPLWPAVNELAGLAPDRPWGASLPEPAEFRLPAAWVDRLPAGRILGYRHPVSGRLQLWTAEPGYLLADLPAWASLTEWPLLDHHLAAPLPLADLPEAANRRLAPPLAWWVVRLRPYFSRLLADMLAMDDPAAAAVTLFHQPATLYLSRTHLDLVQSVEQISLPIRRAGLDRSPGWRPEFGYIITIHFE